MIKEAKVLIKINLRNKKYYQNLGYEFEDVSMGESIDVEINTNDLTKGSKVKVTAICEICESERNLTYSKYYQNFNRNEKGYYSCFKCKSIEMKKTCLGKYGVESYSKTDKFKKFISENLDYEDIHEKCRKTNKEKYGVEFYSQTDRMREINSNWMSSDDFKEKSRKTMLDKYGEDHYSKTPEFKERMAFNKEIIVDKIKQTFILKYGVEWISKSEIWKNKYEKKLTEIRDKIKKTCMDKYGVDNVSKVSEIMDKIMDTKKNNGDVIEDGLLSEWVKYKKQVRKLTNRNVGKLYDEWDGLDYYDGEEISDNKSLNHTDRLYPTIDHKISVFYGFSNDISVSEISDISNLCITKRYINSVKNKMTESEFIS